MAAQPDSDLVTVCTDATEGGTVVRVVAPSRQIRMVDLMPVFERLDLNLVSYTAERDPDEVGNGAQPAPLGRRKHSFRGRFLVTDADGHNLSEAMLDGLVAALQEALHVRLSRLGRCNALQEESRRGSVASYATDASVDPDSPSFATGVAAAAASGLSISSLPGHPSLGHLGHAHSNVPVAVAGGPQCAHGAAHHHQVYFHHHTHSQPQPLQQQDLQLHYQQMLQRQQQQLQQIHQHFLQQQQFFPVQYLTHHEHMASGGSALVSEHSVSSVGSLLRAPSGATSEPPAVPSPPFGTRLDNSTFSFLTQNGETVFLDGGAQQGSLSSATTMSAVTAAAAAAVASEMQSSLPVDERGVGLEPSMPFSTAGALQQPHHLGHTPHHHHTRSQPPPQAQFPAADMYELGVSFPQRASSASSTPPQLSGTLPTINTSVSPAAEAAGVFGPAAAAAASRAAHVSFMEPPAYTSTPATATPMGGTPLDSGPPSNASLMMIMPASGSLPLGSISSSAVMSWDGLGETAAYAVAAATAAAAAASVTAGGSGGTGTVHASGDASPTSTSSEERDGIYTWWSTFTAQDSVARIMSHPARSISAEADLGQAKSLMTKHNISALLVNTGSASPGFITKRDFLKVQFSKNFKRTKVKDVMTQPVIFVDINLPIEQCSRVLEQHGVRRVLVYDPARASEADPLAAFVGVVSDADLFKCMGAPAMSPVFGSVGNSHESAQVASAAPQGAGTSAAPLPALPSLPPLRAPSGEGLSAAQQPQALPALPSAVALLSSAASSASVSVAGSQGPSHAPSVTMPMPMPQQPTVDAACAAALVLASSAGSSVTMRLNAEPSLADRYRCAAALWELDFNELEVTRRIGEGSFGEVLLASFRGTKVAVKRLRGFDVGPDNPDGGPGEPGPSPTQMPIFRQFFEREIEILATIRHPNVVNFIGACHTPPNVCLVTEYCARGSLDHLLHKSSIPLDLLKKVEFSMDIARGMSCLHSQKPPIIHRDLKTANLLVSARFEVKVADFGLSRIKDHAQLINSRAGLEGTVEYAAPEVLRGEPYTEKCDIWSYAVLLWEIIHRQRPYADADVPIYILMMSLGNGTLRLPPVREEVATNGLARLVERCMAWHPADRPSFREVLHALEAEYKILRGKAAAVPRSDSASSMMVLPGGQNRAPGAEGSSAHQHDGHHGAAPGAGAASVATAGAGTSAARPAPHTPLPAQHPHQQQPRPMAALAGVLAHRKSSKLGLSPHTPPPPPEDGGGGEVFARSFEHSPHLQVPPNSGQKPPQQRVRVKLAVPAQVMGPQHHSMTNGGTGTPDGGEPVSPADSNSRPPSSRNPSSSTAGRGGSTTSKPNSGGRPTGRSLRTAARSKSMPLPEFEWFGGDEGSDEYMDTTDSVADEEADGASAGTTVSGAAAAPGGPQAEASPAPPAVAVHPCGLLASDRGGIRSTPYPKACLLQAASSTEEDGPRDTTQEEEEDDDDDGRADRAAAAAATATDLPHHLVVRVVHPGDGYTAAADSSNPVRFSLGHGDHAVSPRERQQQEVLHHPHAQARGQQPSDATASAWGGDVALAVSPLVSAVVRQSPFHMAASSPFADAADTPWSPRGSDEAASSPSCFGSHPMSESAGPSATAQQQQQHQQHQRVPLMGDPARTGPGSSVHEAATPDPPRRAAFVSPFAQLANEVPTAGEGILEEDEEEQDAEDGRHGAEHDEEARRRRRVTASGGGAAAAAVTAAPAQTANSTDVNTAVEKDQQTALNDVCWTALATCSKPPSGDVYPQGGAIGRLSPPANHSPGVPSLASPYGQHTVATADAVKDGTVVMIGEMEEEGEEEDGGEREQRLVSALSSASAGLGALSLALPGVIGFGAPGLGGVRTDSDQFDEDDEDATLHTTAWVRL